MTEDLWHALSHVHEWIRFADQKAAAALTADGLIVTVLASMLSSERGTEGCWYVTATAAVAGLLAMASAVCCLACVIPRLVSGSPSDVLYFARIASFDSAKSYREAIEARLSTPDEVRSEVIKELWTRSIVATEKYKFAKLGMWLLAVCLGSAGLSAALLALPGTCHSTT